MQHQDIIIITAAGAKTWLRERLTPGAWGRMFGEAGIAGYKEKMEALRSVDDRIFEWVKDLHKLVKKMREAAKAARYVDVAIYLSQINKRFQNVKSVGKEIKKLTEEDILPFELEHKQELPQGDLFSADDEDEEEEGLKSEAGLSDMKRRWVAKRLEHDMRAARKVAIKELLNRTEDLVSFAQDKLNDLSRARASGDIGAYIKVIGELSQAQTQFQTYFMPVYKKYLEPLVLRAAEEKKKFEEVEKTNAPENVTESLGLKPSKEKSEELPTVPDLELPQHKNLNLAPPLPNSTVPTPGVVRKIKGPGDLLISPEEKAPTAPTIQAPEGHKPMAFVGLHGMPESRPELFQSISPESSGGLGKFPKLTNGPTTIINPETSITRAPPVPPKAPRKSKAKGPLPPPLPPVSTPPEIATAGELTHIMTKTGHVRFMAELFKAADQNDPYLLSAMLIKYAAKIEDMDLEKSLQLLAVAEGIIDES